MADRTIVNFTRRDEGTGTLVRAVPRVDPNQDGTHQWDVDLAFGVDEVQADHVAPALPQVGEYLARARDGKGSATITIKPTARDVRLTLQGSDGEPVVEDVAAEVRQVKMQLTEKAQSYIARLRLFGLATEESAQLVAHLGKPLRIEVEPVQMALDLDGAPIGAIVTATDGFETVFGELRRKEGDRYVVDDFGTTHLVNTINAALTLAEGSKLKAVDYAVAARDLGGQPSWRYLVAALGEVGDGEHLDDKVIQRATEFHLPAEQGAVGG